MELGGNPRTIPGPIEILIQLGQARRDRRGIGLGHDAEVVEAEVAPDEASVVAGGSLRSSARRMAEGRVPGCTRDGGRLRVFARLVMLLDRIGQQVALDDHPRKRMGLRRAGQQPQRLETFHRRAIMSPRSFFLTRTPSQS